MNEQLLQVTRHQPREMHGRGLHEDDLRYPGRDARGDGKASLLEKTQGSLACAIGEYPLVFLGAALFAGITLGWWVKRK